MKEVPALQAGSHHFHGPQQSGRFPIPFRTEAVAIGHQTLYSNAGNLFQAM